MKASDALRTLAQQVADLEADVARLTTACAAADARAFEASRKPTSAVVTPIRPVAKSANGSKTRGGWATVAVEGDLKDKVGKYLGVPPHDKPGNIARNCKEYLSQLDREYGANAVDAAIKILRKV